MLSTIDALSVRTSQGLALAAVARDRLTVPPCAETVCPTAKMFAAAFASRSWVVPHSGHVHSRTLSGSFSTICPQSEQVFEDGNQRSILTTVLPYLSAFSSIMRMAVPMDASCNERARLWFLAMPRRLRSSTQITSKRVTRSVLSLCSASLRLLAIFSWMRAT